MLSFHEKKIFAYFSYFFPEVINLKMTGVQKKGQKHRFEVPKTFRSVCLSLRNQQKLVCQIGIFHYIVSQRLFSQFLLKVVPETSIVALYITGIMKKPDQNWFGNKNLVKNYQIWTLRFLPFPIFKSLALSTDIFRGLLKNRSSNLARYDRRIVTKKL